MATAEDIIVEARSLPVELRMHIVDSLLESLNPPDPAVEAEGLAIAKHRLADLRAGKTKCIPAEELFDRLRKRMSK